MTGPEHYREAERQLDSARNHAESPEEAAVWLAAAQAHATLAHAAATIYATNFIDGCLPEPHLDEAWNRVTR